MNIKKRKGISLIVLIVTIIVVIILAVVVILTISKNNPVESSREAKFKEDIRTFQDDLLLSISKDYTKKAGQRDNKFNATSYDKIKEYIPSFTKEYEGKIAIYEDDIVYKLGKISKIEEKWINNIGIKKIIDANAVKFNPKEFYGKEITNYKTENIDIDNNTNWKIFHSDGSNIYLIAADYINNSTLPNVTKTNSNGTVTEYKISKIGEYAAYFSLDTDSIVNAYTGSKDILEKSKAKKWISWVDSYSDSKNNNIKAVAYMLDTDIWETYASNCAEYAIGAPTLEMLFDSYNRRYGTEYIAIIKDSTGYVLNRELFAKEDQLYVITDTNRVDNGMWIAAPSSHILYVRALFNKGIASDSRADFTVNKLGFRPIICLKSDVILKEVEGGYEIH